MILSKDSNYTKRIFIYLLYSERSKKVGKESMFYGAGAESGSKVITSSSKEQFIFPEVSAP
jgi:hypothetical protein